MKKIVTILFIIQMSIISFYSLHFLQTDADYQLFNHYETFMNLSFNDSAEALDFFMSSLETKGLNAVRIVYLDEFSMIAYTTDITLNEQVRLKNGRFPQPGTNEFISNVDTGEINQVGVIHEMMPGYQLIISYLNDSPQNFGLNGLYRIDQFAFRSATASQRPFQKYPRSKFME